MSGRTSNGGSGSVPQGNLDPITRLPQLPAINPRPVGGRRTIDDEDLMSESNYAESPNRYTVLNVRQEAASQAPKSMTESVYSDDSKPSSESPRSSDYSPSYSRRVFRKSGYTSSETSSQHGGTTPRLSTLYSPRNSSMTTPRSARATPRRDKVVKGRVDTYSPMIGAREGREGFIMSEGSGIPFNPYLDPFMQMKMMQEKQDKDKEVYAMSGEEAKDNSNRPFNRRYSPIGICIFLFYLGSALFYFITRATKTLDMGFTWYGWLVLLVEIITSTATMGYAVLLIRYTRSKKTKGLPLAKPGHEPDEDNLKFHVRVLVPCYKETVDLVEITVKAALAAPLPADTRRTVYLCDDGNDPNKAEMISRLGKDCVYVTGRKRDPTGEVNGKSNNLNNCLRLIYSEYEPKDIPLSEVIVVFDADMVAKPNFFTKILEVMYDENVALCLTPQAFNNVSPGGDIFNNLNLSFWEYMLPGLDALGYIACTGTNFCIRAAPLADCGWFPNYTITEDYALGIELKKRDYKAVYINEYLAVGEAPEEIRNIFRQRSRWCKGQMQVLFSKHCPLLDGKLSMAMRMLYTSVTWCYITNTIAVPLSVFVPFIALVFGIYPLVLNRDFALASLLYFTSQTMVTMFCIDVRHLKPLWYCQVSCHLLWFTFTKALINILLTKARIKKKVVFKSTKKKGENGEEEEATSCCVPRLAGDLEGTKDYWVLVTSFSISITTCCVGIYQISDEPFTAQGDFRWYLMLSVFWALYNSVPPALFLFYCVKRGRTFEEFCSFCFVLVFLVAFGGLACAWLVPADYNTGQVLGLSLQFLQAQQSGKLPKNFPVPWRQSSNLWDSVILPNGRNYSLVGGWFDQGDGLKVSYTIATTVALLSWSFTEMRSGFATSGNDEAMAASIRWGAEYLMKCHVTNQTGMADIFIGQVGDIKLDHAYWGRPENMAMQRPAYAVDAKRPASDLMGSAAAALAAASVALKQDSAQSSVLYLNRAELLYRIATRNRGLYNKFIPTSSVYPSSTFYDDLAWAAAWLFRATENEAYLADAETFWATSVQTENHVNPNPYMWNYENILPGVHLLLEDFTGNSIYSDYANDYVNSWIRGVDGGIYYTPKGLAKGDPAGTLQHTANAALYVLLYSGRRSGNRYMALNCWARTQIGYMLGDGGRSFVVGYGELSPKKAPHRAASCPDPTQGECSWETAYYSTDTNPNILYGALVGGPDDQDVWFDDRDVNSVANAVGLLNNAGFTAALAGLHGRGINMAKCEQGNGIIQKVILKAKKMTNMPGQRWWEGI